MRAISFFVITIALSSCMTLDKAKDRMRNNAGALAEMCALHFPAQDKIIKGDTVVNTITDTRTDTVTVTIKGEVVKVACPECKSITKTITQTDTIVRIDRAKVFELTDKNNLLIIKGDLLDSKVKKLTKQVRYLMLALTILIIGAMVMRRFRV